MSAVASCQFGALDPDAAPAALKLAVTNMRIGLY